MKTVALLTVLVGAMLPTARAQQAPASNPLFDTDEVHVMHITFAQANWYALLEHNFEDFADPQYAPADFDWDGLHLGTIGVRFKGLSSYWYYPGDKKSFKLDFNRYVSGQNVHGLQKLNLNNAFRDPSFVREKVFYEIAESMELAAPRASFAALYVNDVYFGLFTLVEQIDDEFVEGRFGPTEHGNLWEGEPFGSLQYQGAQANAYYDDYSLETNEEVNDWSALIDLCDRLNNTPQSQLPSALNPVLDVNASLAYLALCSVTLTLDSYLGRMRNGYFYRRDGDGRFVTIPWDANESFGAHPLNFTGAQLAQLDTQWLRPPASAHPLATRLWADAGWMRIYNGHLRRLVDHGASAERVVARMHALRNMIRPWVLGDSKKMYTNAQFEASMLQDVDTGIGGMVPALETLVRARNAFVAATVAGPAPLESVVINEFATVNSGAILDEAGQSDPWIEIVNAGASSVQLAGLKLRPELSGGTVFVFPPLVLAPGARAIVWCDGTPAQGPLHTPFTLVPGASALHLVSNGSVIDFAQAPVLAFGEAWARIPDARGDFRRLTAQSPLAVNTFAAPAPLVVNELLASNSGGLADEAGDFEDWVEIWNGTSAPVDMTGWHLTDDLLNPTKWTFPAVSIAAGGHLLVWCDDEPGEGPLHATFKLGNSGEAVGLFGPASTGNIAVDARVFGPQTANVSHGRTHDGAATWASFATPTPLAPNSGATPIAHVVPYGIGKLTSSSRLPAMAWAGTPSQAVNDFRVRVVSAQPSTMGLVFHGPARAAVPFAGGTRWVAGPLVRMSVHAFDANGYTEYPFPILAPLVGTTRCFQSWFRDVAQTDGTATGLSGALEVVFGV